MTSYVFYHGITIWENSFSELVPFASWRVANPRLHALKTKPATLPLQKWMVWEKIRSWVSGGFFFSLTWWDDRIWRIYFADGLKQPTSWVPPPTFRGELAVSFKEVKEKRVLIFIPGYHYLQISLRPVPAGTGNFHEQMVVILRTSLFIGDVLSPVWLGSILKKKTIHSGKPTWQFKMDPDWRWISYCKWEYSSQLC